MPVQGASAAACARVLYGAGAGPRAGAALHGADRRHPGRRRAGDLGPRRHLSAGPRRGARRDARARDRADLRAHRLHAARRRRPQRASARARPGRGGAAAARRSPRDADAAKKAGKGKRRARVRDGAAEHRRISRPPAPEEILRPVQPVVHRAHARCSRSSPTCCRCRAWRSRCGPTSSRWCCCTGASRSRATSASASPGASASLMDVGDATLFGQHALAYALLAYAAEYFRRRVLRFPLWQQAAQVAVLLGLCAALVLLVRFVGGAPLPRWTYAVPPLVGALLWPLVSVAAAMAAAAAALVGRAVTPPAARADPTMARFLFTSRGAATTAARWARPSSGIRSASLFLFRRRLTIAGALVALALGRAVRALLLPAGRPAPPLPDAGRDEPHRDRARSCPTAA